MSPQAGMSSYALEIVYDATIDHLGTYHQIRIIQFIFQFPTASAAAGYLDTLRAAVSRCPSVTATTNGLTATLKQNFMTAPPVAGHQAFLLRQSGTIPLRQSGTIKGVPDGSRAVLALDGTDVCMEEVAVIGVSIPAQPSPVALIAKLITRVRALG